MASAFEFYRKKFQTDEFADKDTLIRCLLSELRAAEVRISELEAKTSNDPWYCTGQPYPQESEWK